MCVCVAGDGSTYDSLGAALGRRHVGWGSGDMMTIKGALTCQCHVKGLKPVCLTRARRKREISNLFSTFYKCCLSSIFFFNMIIPLCFGNTAIALVPIKNGELNKAHTHRQRKRERENMS